MKHRVFYGVCIGLCLMLWGMSGCVVTVNPAPTTTKVAVSNLLATAIPTGTLTYQVTNLRIYYGNSTVPEATWSSSEIVNYNATSTFVTVSPYSGSVTITGSIKSAAETTWSDGSWNFPNESFTAGSENTLDLSF